MCTRTLKNFMNKPSTELAYLSGVFDGEGSFGTWSRGKKKTRAFMLAVEMTDIDVILKFFMYFKKGSITTLPPRKEGYQRTFKWQVSCEQAIVIVKKMLPFLSKRRQAKFQEDLNGLH